MRATRYAAIPAILAALAAAFLAAPPAARAQCSSPPITQADFADHLGKPVIVDPASNDHDPDGTALSVSFLSTTCNGTVTQDLDLLRLDPEPPWAQSCTLSYKVTDEDGLSATGTVTFTALTHIFADDFETGGVAHWSTCTGGTCGAEAAGGFGRPGSRARMGRTSR